MKEPRNITREIEKDIVHYLMQKNNKFVVPTIYMYDWESDIFCVSKSGYVVEYEIKISRGDFKADLKKEKHLHISGAGALKESYWNKTWDATALNPPIIGERGVERIEEWKNDFKVYTRYYRNTPNRFYYCCPENLISVDEIPAHAGLIYAKLRRGSYDFLEVKKAPVINKEKMKNFQWESLAMKFFYYWNNQISENRGHRFTADNAEREMVKLREKLRHLSKEQLGLFAMGGK
jgi:hypothetical protein